MPPRKAIFTHIEDRIDDPRHDRDKILISVHPAKRSIWYWLIPFSNGRSSIGVVGGADLYGSADEPLMTTLRNMCDAAPNLRRLLAKANWDTQANTIGGYAASVRTLYGPGFALLGNAAEFLDPVFSSGVTIALRSSKLAADALHRQLSGESVDWQRDFAAPAERCRNLPHIRARLVRRQLPGRGVLRTPQAGVRAMISSILAGYAWDADNPYVSDSARRLDALAAICRGATTRAAAR